MHISESVPRSTAQAHTDLRLGYLWMITTVAALGGFLFGYDWVVIGGAKPFYEKYFQLSNSTLVGWANSCALLGCFVGSLVAGRLSDRFGRKKMLICAAFCFVISSLLTGWAQSFSAFICWRIFGGFAIGLASNVSPTYIAEISPAALRGRLVSLNQLALVVGIVAAQIANWRISVHGFSIDHGTILANSWNVHDGWRWMFTATAIPALLFTLLTPLIPESPRWLAESGDRGKALQVLTSIGGPGYGRLELEAVLQSSAGTGVTGAARNLLQKPLRGLLGIGICLAVLQQWCGINVFFNYAEEVYHEAGFNLSQIMFDIVITGAVLLVFTVVAMILVDRLGRRPLMLLGCGGIGASHLLASAAYSQHWAATWSILLTLIAIAFYAMSLAPVTWVLITELFPNSVRATAVSISVAALWLASFILIYTFPFLNYSFGTSGAFVVYGSICVAGFFFIYFFVPETTGRSLEEIEQSKLRGKEIRDQD